MKKLLLMILVLTMTAALCACGGTKEEKTVDLDALTAELAAGGGFTDTLSRPADDVAARLYGFDAADVAKCVLYTGTGATAEEIFLAEATSPAAASSLKAACEERVENQKLVFANYSPEDVRKLDEAVLVVSGNCVILVVTADAAAARSIVENYT